MDEHFPHSFDGHIISYLDSKVNKFLSSKSIFLSSDF